MRSWNDVWKMVFALRSFNLIPFMLFLLSLCSHAKLGFLGPQLQYRAPENKNISFQKVRHSRQHKVGY